MKGSFFLLLLCAVSLNCYALDHAKPIIISLGYRCQPAMQLRFNNLRFEAFPFDWLIVPFDSLCSLLENGFKDFFARDHLVLRSHYPYVDDEGAFSSAHYAHIWESHYDVMLRHDFPYTQDFMNQYEEVYAKYMRRIERFYQTLQAGTHVYFLRQDVTKEQAHYLASLISAKFPTLSYTLIAVDYRPEAQEAWGIENVHNYYLPIPQPYNRDGDNTQWQAIFKAEGFLDENQRPLTYCETKPIYLNTQELYK